MKRAILFALLSLVMTGAYAQQQWTALTTYPGVNAPIKDMMATGNHLFVVTPGGNSTMPLKNIYQSLDNGASWVAADSNIPAYYGGLTVYYDQYRSTLIYGSNAQNGCYTATDLNNPVWTRNASFIRPCVFARIDTTLFFSDQISGVMRTTDDCNTWTAITPPASPPASYYIISKNDTLIASMQFGGTFRSVNKGSSWTAINNGMTNNFNNTYFVKDNYIFAGSYYHGIFRTSDNGDNWMTVNNGLPTALANRNYNSFAVKNDSLFVGGDTLGVYLSTDNGNNWMSFNNGIPSNTTILKLLVANNKLFAGTNDGRIYRLDAAPVTPNGVAGVGIEKDIFVSPNPAKDILHIRNTGGQAVKACLFNITGITCAEQMISPGNADMELSRLADGLYILRISNGRQQKIIISH